MTRELKSGGKRIVLLVVLGLGMLVGLTQTTAAAAPPDQEKASISAFIELVATQGTSLVRVPRRASLNAEGASMAVTINFLPAGSDPYGFGDQCAAWPPAPKAAMSYAAGIWGGLLSSNVPIKVDACWATNLGAGVLGHATPTELYRNFTNSPQNNTWYPVALANALSGSDLNGADGEMYIGIGSSFPWYTDTDGNVPLGKYDLASVMLHEMGHSEGFFGSMKVNPNGTGGWGVNGYPTVYDRHAVNGSGQSLINTNLFANPSTALAAQLTSSNVYFTGTNANAANGGSKVKLYAPSGWAPGSSFSHLDYATFANTPNRLMVYALASGTSVHDPGAVTLGVLKDVGWSVAASGCYTLATNVSPNGAGSVSANPAPNCNGGTQYNPGTNVTLTATAGAGSTFTGWSGGASGATNPIVVQLNADTSVTANFSSPVTLVRVYTTDNQGNPKTKFKRGEKIRYYAEVVNNGAGTISAKSNWSAKQNGASLLTYKGKLDTAPGTTNFYIRTRIPMNASAGMYTFKVTLTINGVRTTQNVEFKVKNKSIKQGSEGNDTPVLEWTNE